MTAKRTIKRTPKIDLRQAMLDYLLNRSMRERSAREEDGLKKSLMAWLETHGDVLELDDPISFVSYAKGTPNSKLISGAKRTTRRSKVLDDEKALEFLDKKGLYDECTEKITVLNEDAILAANFEGRITDAEMAALYNENVTYAFNLVEG